MRPRARTFAALALGGLLSFVSLTVHAVSFDCAMASTPVEQMICDSSELSALDDQIVGAYVELRDSLHEGDQQALREEQQAWLKGRDACTDTACVATLSRDRIEQLRMRLSPSPLADRASEPTATEAPTAVDKRPPATGQVPSEPSSNTLLLIVIGSAVLVALGVYFRQGRKAGSSESASEDATGAPPVADSAGVPQSFCTQCGTRLAPEIKFCTGCGAKRG